MAGERIMEEKKAANNYCMEAVLSFIISLIPVIIIVIIGMFTPITIPGWLIVLAPGIVSIAFGVWSLKKIKDSQLRGKTFAIIGIIIGAIDIITYILNSIFSLF